jgi:hypothetical protein
MPLLFSLQFALHLYLVRNKNHLVVQDGFRFGHMEQKRKAINGETFPGTGQIMPVGISRYLLYFTDRQGVPIGIDTSELPMQTGRISNRNKFILGPSGTGKSFVTNRYIKQCHVLGADVVLIDTGHSYFGTNQYFGGRYITYSEERPITMNPFRIEPVENNEEKRQILKSLIGLIWKGVEGYLNQVEDTVLSKIISDYYAYWFLAILRLQPYPRYPVAPQHAGERQRADMLLVAVS